MLLQCLSLMVTVYKLMKYCQSFHFLGAMAPNKQINITLFPRSFFPMNPSFKETRFEVSGPSSFLQSQIKNVRWILNDESLTRYGSPLCSAENILLGRQSDIRKDGNLRT